MNAQNIVVALIVLGALAYVVSQLWKKVRAFKPVKKGDACEADCGCESRSDKAV
jgi:hypothetical protein